MKKEIKKGTPEVIVNLVNAETPEDVRFEFILAKTRAGIAIKEEDVKWLLAAGAKMVCEIIDDEIEKRESETIKIKDNALYEKLTGILTSAIVPKKPWYKRFWGWITKPFRKAKPITEEIRFSIEK